MQLHKTKERVPFSSEKMVDERSVFMQIQRHDGGQRSSPPLASSRKKKSWMSPRLENFPCLNEGGYQLKRKCLRFVDDYVEESYKDSVSRASICKGFAYMFLFVVWAVINIAQAMSDFQGRQHEPSTSKDCTLHVVCTGWILIATASFIPIIPPAVSFDAGSRLTEVFFGLFSMVQLVLMSTMAHTTVAIHMCGGRATGPQPATSANAAIDASTTVLSNQLLILIFLGSSTDMRFAVFLGPLSTFLCCGIANWIYTAATNEFTVLFSATRICLFYFVISACFYFGLERMEKQRRATYVTLQFQNNGDIQSRVREHQVEREMYERFITAEEVAGIEQALQEVFDDFSTSITPAVARKPSGSDMSKNVVEYIESQMKRAVLTSRKRGKIVDDIIAKVFDESYTVVAFSGDVVNAFPELALYRAHVQTSSGRGVDAELERTRGAFFAIFWILREHMDGRFGFCFGADETGKVYFHRTDEDDVEEPAAVAKAPLPPPSKPPPPATIKPTASRTEVSVSLPIPPATPSAYTPSTAAHPHLLSSTRFRSHSLSTGSWHQDSTVHRSGATSLPLTSKRFLGSPTQQTNRPTNAMVDGLQPKALSNATVGGLSMPRWELAGECITNTPLNIKARLSAPCVTASSNWRIRGGVDRPVTNWMTEPPTPSSPSNARPCRPIKNLLSHLEQSVSPCNNSTRGEETGRPEPPDFRSSAPAVDGHQDGGNYVTQASDPSFSGQKSADRKPKKFTDVFRSNSKGNVDATRDIVGRHTSCDRQYPLAKKKSFFSMTRSEKRQNFFNHMPWKEMRCLFYDAGIISKENTLDPKRMRTLLVLTAMHDICKIENLWPAVAPEHAPFHGYLDGDVIGDHDIALAYILTHYPHVLPSFHDGLSYEDQQTVLFTQSKMGFNHGWLVQGESPPGPLFHSFKTLIDAQGVSSQDVAFYFVHWLTDLAGAEPTPMRGSEKFVLKFPDQVLRQFISSFPFIHRLSTQSETAVYEDYLQYTWKEMQAADPLVFHDLFYNGEAISLLRLLLHAQRNAVHVFHAFKALAAAHRRLLGEEMSMTGVVGQHYSCCESRSGPCILVYYAPAFLQKNADSFENAFSCLEALVEIYRQGRILFESHYSEVGTPAEGEATSITIRLDKLKEAPLKDIVARPIMESGVDVCWVITKTSTQEAGIELAQMDVLNTWSAEGKAFRFLSFPKAPQKHDVFL
eukprot:GEMP01003490.1.p1 GENE.GEMP01003490.1~~GEMP01003490.1.p1  ORF type:complete len:1202 (-),score=187.88 GEMP01003490.1:759-4364(-)